MTLKTVKHLEFMTIVNLTIIVYYRYLDDNYHTGLNLEAPSGRLPELSFYNELPPIPSSPTSTVEAMSNRSDSNSVADEDADQLIHDWSSD